MGSGRDEGRRGTSVLASHTLQRYCHVISKHCNVFLLQITSFSVTNNVLFLYK